jgi:hypothetical protein
MIKYYYVRSKPAVSNKARLVTIDEKLVEVRDVQRRGTPVACIAYQRRRDEDMSPPIVDGETPEQTRAKGWDLVTYALSACHSRDDEFTKFDGRVVAFDRLTGTCRKEKKPMDEAYCFNIESTASANEVIEMIIDEVVNNPVVPAHVRRACKNWLDS